MAISGPNFVRLELTEDGTAVARFRAEIKNETGSSRLTLAAHPHFIVDGGATNGDDLPEGFRLKVRSITLGDREFVDSSSVALGDYTGTVDVVISTVPNAAAGLKLVLSEGLQE